MDELMEYQKFINNLIFKTIDDSQIQKILKKLHNKIMRDLSFKMYFCKKHDYCSYYNVVRNKLSNIVVAYERAATYFHKPTSLELEIEPEINIENEATTFTVKITTQMFFNKMSIYKKNSCVQLDIKDKGWNLFVEITTKRTVPKNLEYCLETTTVFFSLLTNLSYYIFCKKNIFDKTEEIEYEDTGNEMINLIMKTICAEVIKTLYKAIREIPRNFIDSRPFHATLI